MPRSAISSGSWFNGVAVGAVSFVLPSCEVRVKGGRSRCFGGSRPRPIRRVSRAMPGASQAAPARSRQGESFAPAVGRRAHEPVVPGPGGSPPASGTRAGPAPASSVQRPGTGHPKRPEEGHRGGPPPACLPRTSAMDRRRVRSRRGPRAGGPVGRNGGTRAGPVRKRGPGPPGGTSEYQRSRNGPGPGTHGARQTTDGPPIT